MTQPPLALFAFCPKCGSNHFVINDFKSKRCQTCGFVYYDNAAAAVAGFIVHDDKLLLCTRAKQPAQGLLDLPGGFIDHAETAEQALAREIDEELGLSVVRADYLFSLPNTYVYSDFTVHTLDLFFKVEVADCTHIHCADDVATAHFHDFHQINLAQIGLDSIRQGVEKFLLQAP
ncbi:MAG: NUDIX domain-containing protein [Paludibacteraceae bacterium]